MPAKKYAVLSPDGFTIELHRPHYRSMKARKEAFDQWVKRFENQGYYSSLRHRIPLDQLKDECHFLTLQGKETIIERSAQIMKRVITKSA